MKYSVLFLLLPFASAALQRPIFAPLKQFRMETAILQTYHGEIELDAPVMGLLEQRLSELCPVPAQLIDGLPQMFDHRHSDLKVHGTPVVRIDQV